MWIENFHKFWISESTQQEMPEIKVKQNSWYSQTWWCQWCGGPQLKSLYSHPDRGRFSQDLGRQRLECGWQGSVWSVSSSWQASECARCFTQAGAWFYWTIICNMFLKQKPPFWDYTRTVMLLLSLWGLAVFPSFRSGLMQVQVMGIHRSAVTESKCTFH